MECAEAIIMCTIISIVVNVIDSLIGFFHGNRNDEAMGVKTLLAMIVGFACNIQIIGNKKR